MYNCTFSKGGMPPPPHLTGGDKVYDNSEAFDDDFQRTKEPLHELHFMLATTHGIRLGTKTLLEKNNAKSRAGFLREWTKGYEKIKPMKKISKEFMTWLEAVVAQVP